MKITYRLFDLSNENVSRLFELYKSVYGDATAYIKRWEWEINKNPNIDAVKILVAECGDMIVGASTRLPFKIKMNDEVHHSAFSINSMVHPDFRRKGIIQDLYKKSFDLYPILFSKSTVPGMYKLLMKMGYQCVKPDTVMTSILSYSLWPLWRLGLYKPEANIENVVIDSQKGFHEINRFGSEYDEFRQRVLPRYKNIIIKDSAYMNWRYSDNPWKKYKILYKKKNNEIMVMVVIAQSGTTAKIVDLLWDREHIEELALTIKYIKRICKKCGFLKILCWTPMKELRTALKSNKFMDTIDIDNLSFITSSDSFSFCFENSDLLFVSGDGDSEYLS